MVDGKNVSINESFNISSNRSNESSPPSVVEGVSPSLPKIDSSHQVLPQPEPEPEPEYRLRRGVVVSIILVIVALIAMAYFFSSELKSLVSKNVESDKESKDLKKDLDELQESEAKSGKTKKELKTDFKTVFGREINNSSQFLETLMTLNEESFKTHLKKNHFDAIIKNVLHDDELVHKLRDVKLKQVMVEKVLAHIKKVPEKELKRLQRVLSANKLTVPRKDIESVVIFIYEATAEGKPHVEIKRMLSEREWPEDFVEIVLSELYR